MARVSIVIPSRNEPYLNRTIEDVFEKATGDFEVIVVLDGPTDFPPLPERDGLTYIVKPQAEGLRPALRDAANAATGKYLLKIDAHEALSPGFDEVLQEGMEDDWVVVSRYYRLDVESWQPIPDTERDYYYLAFPFTNTRKASKNGSNLFIFLTIPWESRKLARRDVLIDDQMGIQASLWMMAVEHFKERLGGLDDRWGSWSCEQQEIALKTWQGGGRVIINKNAWNAHYPKPMEERVSQFPEYSRNQDARNHIKFARYWLKDKWKDRKYDFDYVVDKFWPLPTEPCHTVQEKYWWPEDWRETYYAYRKAKGK